MTAPTYHGWTHRPRSQGGTDPIPGFGEVAAEMGPWHQLIPLRYFAGGGAPPGLDVLGYEWVTDPTSATGGYVEATADGDYFTSLVQLAPKGSIWHLNLRRAVGPDFGRISFALASLDYESTARPSGDPTGKIQGVDGAYGTFAYVDMFQGATTFSYDAYGVAAVGEGETGSSIPFIIGGDIGDPLTDFDTGVTDPMTGFTLMDGGPGWYRLKCYTDGKNASSSGYKNRISEVLLTRRADDNAP